MARHPDNLHAMSALVAVAAPRAAEHARERTQAMYRCFADIERARIEHDYFYGLLVDADETRLCTGLMAIAQRLRECRAFVEQPPTIRAFQSQIEHPTTMDRVHKLAVLLLTTAIFGEVRQHMCAQVPANDPCAGQRFNAYIDEVVVPAMHKLFEGARIFPDTEADAERRSKNASTLAAMSDAARADGVAGAMRATASSFNPVMSVELFVKVCVSQYVIVCGTYVPDAHQPRAYAAHVARNARDEL